MRIQPKTSYKLHPVQTLCVFLLIVSSIAAATASGSALANALPITNLTNYSSGMSAGAPSINDKGQVAWSVFFNSNDTDLFVDGINRTPGTPNQINAGPSLNDSGNVAWSRVYSAASPLSGTYEVLLDGAVVAGGSVLVAGGPQLNNAGQMAWSQYTTEWDIFQDGVNLTAALPGSAQVASLNDSGQVAWSQQYDGQSNIYLDGVNLTSALDGEAYNPTLNNLGQVAWVQWSGTEFDLFLDGVNLTLGIQGDVQQASLNDLGQIAWWQFNQGEYDVFLDGVNLTDWTHEAAFHPSLNNRGQVAWDMGRDIYLASPMPVPEPETYAMFLAGLPLIGVALRRRTIGVCRGFRPK